MNINICRDANELGSRAGKAAAQYLKETIEANGYARIVLSTGSSQFETLNALIDSDVDWSRVEMFHLDEYVGLPETHIASFRKYLNERFISKVNLMAYYLVDGNPESIPCLTEKLREKPVDLGIIGIGENGHIAFNDPPADFDTTEAYIVVNLDEKCKKQQVGEGWFKTIDDVPKQAISMTPYQIMKCRKIITCAPHGVKANAIRATLYEKVSNKIPATLLRTHPDWSLYIDENSAKLVKRNEVNLPIRCGVVGIGGMGTGHVRFLTEGRVKNMCLTAVADIDPKRLEWARENLEGIATFATAQEMYDSSLVDAVIIATPHYDHPSLTIEAFKRGLHVMCEKPAGVYTKQVREMIAAADKYGKSLGIVFCVRTNSAYRKIKEIVESNKYGELHRFNWIITDWYRTQAYYNLSSWRATWSGEGGGVLINQCPHNLDLWQWMCGMPSKIRAVCKEGLWHDIEVEDDVTIFAEYENGATGVFVASTGDYPGSNRLEITLDRAKIVYENDNLLHIYELSDSLKENCAGAQKAFEKISYTERVIDTDERSTGHVGILEAFANNILYDTPLLADGREGINELSISNAAHLSSWTNSEVTLPLDDELFYKELQKKIAGSKEKKVENKVETDLSGSFH